MTARRAVVGACVALLALAALTNAAVGQSSASNGEVESSAEVRNERPANVRLVGAGDADPQRPGEQVTPSAGRPVTVTVRYQAEDANGWKDVRGGYIEVYAPDGTLHRGPIQADVAGQGNGKKTELSASFDMSHSDKPGVYGLRLYARDRLDDVAVGNASFEYQELLALAVDAKSISFGAGALTPGGSSHDQPSGIPVRNLGNVLLDLHVSASPLRTKDGDASIGPDRIRYSPTPDMANEVPLSEAGYTDAAFNLAPGQGPKTGWLDLHVPTGEEQYLPAARYTGEIRVGAVVG